MLSRFLQDFCCCFTFKKTYLSVIKDKNSWFLEFPLHQGFFPRLLAFMFFTYKNLDLPKRHLFRTPAPVSNIYTQVITPNALL